MDAYVMTRQDQLDRIEELRWQLVDIERQQQDNTLSHSDQQLLDQAWEDITNEIDELEDVIATGEEIEAEWRDATEYLEDHDDEEDDAEEFVRSHTVPAGITVREGKVKIVTFAPPPPVVRVSAEQLAQAEKELAAAIHLPLPQDDGECQCDNYGDECDACLADRAREDCARCSGCYACQGAPGYDGADEI